MKQSCTCPKCQSKRLYVIEGGSLPSNDSINGTQELTFAAAWLPTGEKGFLGNEMARYQVEVEAWVCAQCGYAELYANQLANLAYMVKHRKGNVRFVDATPGSGGAFR